MGTLGKIGSVLGISSDPNQYSGPIPEGLGTVKEIHFGKYASLDVVWSAEPVGALPVIIYFGSWTFFGKERGRKSGLCAYMAKRGLSVVCVRLPALSKDISIDEELENLASLLRWVSDNAHNYRFNLGEVYVAASSYGAPAALWTVLLCNTRRIRRVIGLEEFGYKIKGLGLFNGRTDIGNGDVRMQILSREIRAIGRSRPELASCLLIWENHDLRTLPPIFQATSSDDPCRRDTDRLNELLELNKVPHETLVFGRGSGTSEGFMELRSDGRESARTLSRMLNFFSDQ